MKKKCIRGCEGPNVPCCAQCDPDRYPKEKEIPILQPIGLGSYWKWYS